MLIKVISRIVPKAVRCYTNRPVIWMDPKNKQVLYSSSNKYDFTLYKDGQYRTVSRTEFYNDTESVGMLTEKNITSEQPNETLIRIELASLYRICHMLGWSEGICNHITYALPNNLFMVSPLGLMWSEVTPDDLIIVDGATGEPIGQSLAEEVSFNKPSATAYHLHSQMHKLTKSTSHACLIHLHAPYSTALTMIEGGKLEQVHQNSMRFQDQIAYDTNYNGLILDELEGRRLADVMGDKKILFMGNHGTLVAGATVALAFNTMYYLERACMHQVLAMSTGELLRVIDPIVTEEAKKYFPGAEEEYYANHHFEAMRRQIRF